MFKISTVFQLKHKIYEIISFVFTSKPKMYSMIFPCLWMHNVRVLEQVFVFFFFFNLFWNNLGYTENLSKYLSSTQTLHVCILQHLIFLFPSLLLSSSHKYTEIFWSERVRGKHGITLSLNSCLFVCLFFIKSRTCSYVTTLKLAKLQN